MEAWVIKRDDGEYWSEEFREFGKFNYLTLYPCKDMAMIEILQRNLDDGYPVKVRIEEVEE